VLGAQRHVCGLFSRVRKEYQLVRDEVVYDRANRLGAILQEENPFFVPLHELLRELREHRETLHWSRPA